MVGIKDILLLKHKFTSLMLLSTNELNLFTFNMGQAMLPIRPSSVPIIERYLRALIQERNVALKAILIVYLICFGSDKLDVIFLVLHMIIFKVIFRKRNYGGSPYKEG